MLTCSTSEEASRRTVYRDHRRPWHWQQHIQNNVWQTWAWYTLHPRLWSVGEYLCHQIAWLAGWVPHDTYLLQSNEEQETMPLSSYQTKQRPRFPSFLSPSRLQFPQDMGSPPLGVSARRFVTLVAMVDNILESAHCHTGQWPHTGRLPSQGETGAAGNLWWISCQVPHASGKIHHSLTSWICGVTI